MAVSLFHAGQIPMVGRLGQHRLQLVVQGVELRTLGGSRSRGRRVDADGPGIDAARQIAFEQRRGLFEGEAGSRQWAVVQM